MECLCFLFNDTLAIRYAILIPAQVGPLLLGVCAVCETSEGLTCLEIA